MFCLYQDDLGNPEQLKLKYALILYTMNGNLHQGTTKRRTLNKID